MSQTTSDAFQKNKIMSNEPNKAPNAPASDAANLSDKTGVQAKPEAVITPAPANKPAEEKKI